MHILSVHYFCPLSTQLMSEIHVVHSPDPCFSSFPVTSKASPNTEYRGTLWPMTIPTH